MAKKITSLLIAMGLLMACGKENFGPQSRDGSLVEPDSSSILIVNEGNFQWGNASIGQYSADQKRYSEGLYREANDRPLGDVLESIHRIDNRYYLLLNGSNALKICDHRWKETHALSLEGAPRELTVHQQSLWIIDWYSSKLVRLNLEGELVQRLEIGKAARHIRSWNGKLLLSEARIIKSIDPTTLKIDTIALLSSDLSSWTSTEQELILGLRNGQLIHLDQSGTQTSEQLDKPVLEMMATAANRIFEYRDGTIYTKEKLNDNWQYTYSQSSPCANFYGMAFSKQLDALLVFDAKNFSLNAEVKVYRGKDLQLYDSFEAGAISSGIAQLD